ncbi:MAG TPA: hypothetical protein VEB00_14765 [Clostridia bacterium]|nr:hypothetical protein [Clostridia bacterium]
MKKTMALLLIALTIIAIQIGCVGKSEQPKELESKVIYSELQTSNLSEQVKKLEKDKIDTKYSKWIGNWSMGEQNGIGASAKLNISNANKKQFSFSIDAYFISTILTESGELIPNPHEGNIAGIAYFTSSKEAYFTTKEYPDYKMIFKLTNENVINIEEINIKTGQDYGQSPFAGMNVRYSGIYTKKILDQK